MKRFFVLVLVVLLLIAGAAAGAPAAAAEQPARESAAVSLATVEPLLREYSLDMKTALNTLDQARADYRDKKEWGEATQADRDAMEAAELTYRDTTRKLIVSAKRQYLEYCAASSQFSADRAAAENARARLDAAAGRLQKGYVSQSAYDAALENYQRLQAAADAQDAELTRGRKALRTLLNLPDGVSMDVQRPADSEFDFSAIPSLKYEEDVIAVRRENAAIQKDSMNYATVRKDIASSDRDVENAQIRLTQTESSQTAAFRSLYDGLVQSYATYRQECDQAARRQREADAEARQLAAGYISRVKYEDTVTDLQSLQCRREADRNSLYISLLQYLDMKDGVSAP